MNSPVREIDYKGCKIKIYTDDYYEADMDFFSSRACWHRSYTLSTSDVETRTDKRKYSADYYFDDADDFKEFTMINDVVYFPLFLYDHSGITISMSPFSCPWDSGQVGWVFVTYEKIRKEYKVKRVTKKILEKVKGLMQAEVRRYDDMLTGNVYGFVAEDNEGNEIQSCWGFVGDIKDSGILEDAKSQIDWYIKEQKKAHNEKLKTWIKNKVPLQYRESMPEELYNY